MKTVLRGFETASVRVQGALMTFLDGEQAKGEGVSYRREGRDLHVSFTDARQEERLSIFMATSL